MAKSQVPEKVEKMIGKTVQELVLDAEDLQKDYYIHKEGGDGFRDALVPLEGISVIDLHNLTSPSTAEQELAKLHSALISWGCFQVISHGMESSFLEKFRQVSKQFFELPMDEKKKYAKELPSGIEGYDDDYSTLVAENQILEWADRLYLYVQPEDRRNFKFWPEIPNDFRSIILQYTENIRLLSEVIHKAMAKSLNLEENSFLEQIGERAAMDLRFNYYPPCSMPDHVLGLNRHADKSTITFLLQDKQVEDLQVLKDNQWFKVPIISDALLINVGDQIEIMSNGIFKSPIHRLVIDAEKERLTLAMFCYPDLEKEIKPVEKLVNESRPLLYKPVKNYHKLFFQYFGQGKRLIEISKIDL